MNSSVATLVTVLAAFVLGTAGDQVQPPKGQAMDGPTIIDIPESNQPLPSQELGLQDAEPIPVGPVLVKKQDRLRLTARIGAMVASVQVEALQEGRIGETIRVLNVDSKQLVQGRVVSSEEVEVPF